MREFEPTAWPTSGSDRRVYIACGWVRFTATAEEAEAFAALLLKAAEEVRGDS
ncbi:hypothetical protein Mycch_2204 [Mycolicibacterium chubuense NBB4]|uniref:Uncharacterized protein n=1 Tax=Mycolicibacterium chubuense (strain NBB4) TaxID=710421 RepID=I4BI80_MYCCN|nr:hypothetical protein Mycch_2204 [Mycolicibacterium chubuense NBB4]